MHILPCDMCRKTLCFMQYLQNRTDSQLAEVLEAIRAANYRRFMAINVIYSSLPRAFSSSNVLGMLQVPVIIVMFFMWTRYVTVTAAF